MAAPIPFVYPVRSVESQHDGDTLDVVLDLGFDTFRLVTLRLAGLDTPEVTGASKAAGLAVRDWVSRRLRQAKVLTVQSLEVDKYGRSLAILYLDGKPLNDDLVARGMALPYNGGNRTGTWTAAALAKAQAAAAS